MIYPFDARTIKTDQPWLTETHHAQAAEYISFPGLVHYILTTDFRIVEEPNVIRWGIFMEQPHRKIDLTVICKGRERQKYLLTPSWAQQHSRFRPPSMVEETFVSTVFLGYDKDQLFETMIFGGWLNGIMWRSTTLERAKVTHWKAADLAFRLRAYLRRHPSIWKDWIRLNKFWELRRKRGTDWAMKHIGVMSRVEARLSRLPGYPDLPMPDTLFSLCKKWSPRTEGP